MLKWFGFVALISAGVFAAALIGLMIGYSWQPPTQERHQQAAAEHEYKQEYREQEKPFWQRATTDPVAAFTLWLVVFTAVLGVTSVLQYGSLIRGETTNAKSANAAERAAQAAETALVTVQRAFVFIDSFDASNINNNIVIMPKWRNSGTTPTRFMTNYVNWKSFANEPSPDFSFPDLDGFGNPIAEKDKKFVNIFIGPNATSFAEKLVVPTAHIDAVREKRERVFVWGWARYEDIFGNKHITRFCNEMEITPLGGPEVATPAAAGKHVSLAIAFPYYGRNNCTDEECGRQGIP
jgi:hypothetical protein